MPLDPLNIQAVYDQTKQESDHILAGYDQSPHPAYQNAPTPFFKWLHSTPTLKVVVLFHESVHLASGPHRRMCHMAALMTRIASTWGHHVGAYVSRTGTWLPFQPDVIHSLCHHTSRSSTPLTGDTPSLPHCLSIMQRAHADRCVMVVLSDFIEPDWEPPLHQLSQTHYVTPVVIHDPPPSQWPATRLLPVIHPVSGLTQWINPQHPLTRSAIESAWHAHTHRLNQTFRMCHLTPLYALPDTPCHTLLQPKKGHPQP